MRKIDQRSRSILLLLLFVGSFVLHPLIHGSGCCTDSVRPDTGRENICRTITRPDHKTEFHAVETFCPICAGWLTTDCPERTGSIPVCRDSQTVISATDDPAAAPDCRLPSPRAPPAA